MREPVIVDVVRTAFGKRGGALANWHPADLLGFALTTLIERTGVDPARIDDVIGGCVSQVGEQSTNLARNGVGLGRPAPERAGHDGRSSVRLVPAGRPLRCRRGGGGPLRPGDRLWSRGHEPGAARVERTGRDRSVPAVVHGGGGRTALDPVPGQPGAGRSIRDHARGDGCLRVGVAPTGRRELGQRALRTRSDRGTDQGRGRQPDGGVPPQRRRHPSFLDDRGTRRAATGPELGAGHGARHHGRQFVADDRRRGRHADRRPFGGRVTGSSDPCPLRPLRRDGGGCGHCAVGSRTGHPQAPEAFGHESRRVRRGGVQRGVRRHRA